MSVQEYLRMNKKWSEILVKFLNPDAIVFELQMRGAGRSRVVKRKSPPCSCSSLLRKRFEKISRDAAPRCSRSVTLLRRRPKMSSVGGRDGRFACVAKHCDLSSRPPLPGTCFGA